MMKAKEADDKGRRLTGLEWDLVRSELKLSSAKRVYLDSLRDMLGKQAKIKRLKARNSSLEHK